MSVQKNSTRSIIIDAEVMASINHLVQLSDEAGLTIDELLIVLRGTIEQVKAGQ